MDDFKKRLLRFVESRELSQRGFEGTCGLAQGTISSIKVKGPSVDVLTKISNAFPDLDMNWLVSGKGDMLHNERKSWKQIPLLPFSAVAGYMSDNNGLDAFRGDSVMFKDFSDRGADCVIRIDGDSMMPRYRSGDVLAIRILKDPSFFQWGRVYVLSTTQGCVVKKLFPDPEDEEKIICHSENSDNYPDYKIMKQEIMGVAIVVGHAGVE